MSEPFKKWAKDNGRASADLVSAIDTRVDGLHAELRVAHDWDTTRFIQGNIRALLDIKRSIQEK